jgi:hypothetical protein
MVFLYWAMFFLCRCVAPLMHFWVDAFCLLLVSADL